LGVVKKITEEQIIVFCGNAVLALSAADLCRYQLRMAYGKTLLLSSNLT
jgi:hypothetical protein